MGACLEESRDAEAPGQQSFLERDAGISEIIGHVALTAQAPVEISEDLLRTCTDAERPPRPLLRSFGGLAGGLPSFKSSLHCKDQEPRSWVRPLSQ